MKGLSCNLQLLNTPKEFQQYSTPIYDHHIWERYKHKLQFGFAAVEYMSSNTAETVKKQEMHVDFFSETLKCPLPSPAASFFLQAFGPIALNCILELSELI